MKIRLSTILIRTLPVVLSAAALWLWVELRPITHPPGVLVANAPATLPAPPIPLPAQDGAQPLPLKRVAQVRAQGRILSVQRYRDELASMAPIDIVIGWGKMSDSMVLKQTTVTQQDRNYEVRWSAQPLLTPEETAAQTANLHLIPGNEEAALWVSGLKPGMLVDLRGSLVEEEESADRQETPSPVSNSIGATTMHGEPGESIAAEIPPKIKGCCLLYLASGYDFQGRSHQDLRANALREYEAQETADLKQWFASLEERRKGLDVNDPVAVREFNREAARYMELAHPERRKSQPAALRP